MGNGEWAPTPIPTFPLRGKEHALAISYFLFPISSAPDGR
jgi:hypothetical protein